MANQAVYGIVKDRAKAENIIRALVDLGVNPQDISFLSSQGESFREFNLPNANLTNTRLESNRNWRTEDRVTDYPTRTPENIMENDFETEDVTRKNKFEREDTSEQYKGGLGTEKHSKAPEGTTTGVVTGGIIGGTLGLLAGIGALAIPGLGPFIAAGPLMGALAGIGSGGALGGLIGALVGAGIPEFEAKRYENHLKEGGMLISVRANDDNLAKRVKDILNQKGAEDVSISSEATSSKKYNQ